MQLMHSPENAPNWRDLNNQLTFAEIATLKAMERELAPHNLLVVARLYVGTRLAISVIDTIPPPASVARLYEWEDADTPEAYRSFDVAAWEVDGDRIAVDLCGK